MIHNTLFLIIHNYLNEIHILFSQDSRTTHEIAESLHCLLKVSDENIKQRRLKKKHFKSKKVKDGNVELKLNEVTNFLLIDQYEYVHALVMTKTYMCVLVNMYNLYSSNHPDHRAVNEISIAVGQLIISFIMNNSLPNQVIKHDLYLSLNM